MKNIAIQEINQISGEKLREKCKFLGYYSCRLIWPIGRLSQYISYLASSLALSSMLSLNITPSYAFDFSDFIYAHTTVILAYHTFGIGCYMCN